MSASVAALQVVNITSVPNEEPTATKGGTEGVPIGDEPLFIPTIYNSSDIALSESAVEFDSKIALTGTSAQATAAPSSLTSFSSLPSSSLSSVTSSSAPSSSASSPSVSAIVAGTTGAETTAAGWQTAVYYKLGGGTVKAP
jgi:hypothetical protein